MEVDSTINEMGIKKARGDDDVLAECIKYGGKALREEVAKMVKEMWKRAADAEEGHEADEWPR